MGQIHQPHNFNIFQPRGRERERERAGDGGGDAVVMHDDACANKKCRTTTAMELHVLSNPDVRNLNDKIEPVLVQL